MTGKPEITDEARRELVETLEARRHQADSFAWAVPGLAIAAQAFLLSIALSPDTEPAGRLIAAVAGIVTLLGSMHLLVKQNYHFDLYETVIERERKILGLQSVQLDGLLVGPFPDNTQFAKDAWQTRPILKWAIRIKARRAWVVGVFGTLLVLDVTLVVYSIWSLVCDPGWL